MSQGLDEAFGQQGGMLIWKEVHFRAMELVLVAVLSKSSKHVN
jgi:hypothetical protein